MRRQWLGGGWCGQEQGSETCGEEGGKVKREAGKGEILNRSVLGGLIRPLSTK